MNPVQAYVEETTTDSPYSVNIEVSGFQLNGDEPEPNGKGLGPSPYDLLLASLAECTAMTVRWYALRQEWPVDKVSVTATHEKQKREDIFTKKVKIVAPELDDEQIAKLMEVASKCPVHRTLLSDQVSITTTEQD